MVIPASICGEDDPKCCPQKDWRRTSEMPKGKRVDTPPDPKVILEIAKSILSRWQQAGKSFSTLNTDPSGRNAIGIVLDGAYICENCGDWLMREKDHTKNVCPKCEKK